jgi:hypothetical protein
MRENNRSLETKIDIHFENIVFERKQKEIYGNMHLSSFDYIRDKL